MGITIDVMEAAESGDVETISLLSGDGDFDLLLKKVQQAYGISTEVYGVPKLTAGSLVEAACHFHPIRQEYLM